MSLATEVFEVNNLSTLKIKFDCGVDNDGKQIIKSRSFSNVAPNATALNVYNVAETLTSLQKHTLSEVLKQDNTVVTA